jgi:uncharacterized repeat protein (TIGR03809 family)
MTHRQDVYRIDAFRQDLARGRDVAARWCALAEQRLEHLTEMFETGRWRRFHSEIAFLENIQEAKRAVQVWRLLAAGEDVSTVASAWSARGWSPATLSRPGPRDRAPAAQTVQPKAVHIEPQKAVPVVLNTAPDVLAEVKEAPIAPLAAILPTFSQDAVVTDPPPAPERVIEFTFSLDGIEAKYPLLRNVF